MKCEEPEEDCPEEAVGQDIQGWNLCRDHLAFSTMVQKLCNASLDGHGMGHLVPIEFRFTEDPDRKN